MTELIQLEDERLAWFALRVRSNFEKVVSNTLFQKGFEAFLPTYRSRRRWSDRSVDVELPLFPGYVFCRLDLAKRLPVLATPGVVTIVGAGRQPEPVSEEEIATVRMIVESRLQASPWPFLRVGQRVYIDQGPLAGAEGFLVSFKSGYRLVVSISLLQRCIAAEIDGDWVRPTGTPFFAASAHQACEAARC